MFAYRRNRSYVQQGLEIGKKVIGFPFRLLGKAIGKIPLPENIKKSAATLKKLMPFFKPESQTEVIDTVKAGSVAVGTMVITAAIPTLFRELNNAVKNQLAEPPSEAALYNQFVFGIVLAYGCGWTLSQISYSARKILIGRISDTGVRKFQQTMITEVAELSHEQYIKMDSDKFIGALNRASSSTFRICQSLATTLVPLAGQITISLFDISYHYGISFGVGSFAVLAVCHIYAAKTMDLQNGAEKEWQEISKEVDASTAHLVKNYETIHFNHQLRRELASHATLLQARDLKNDHKTKLYEVTPAGLTIITGLSLTALLTRVSQGDYSLEDFSAINMYMVAVIQSAFQMSWAFTELQQGISSVDESLSMLEDTIEGDRKREAEIIHLRAEIPRTWQSLLFRDVGLQYGDKQALSKINLQFEQAQITALVGESGSGKTSLTRLLFRFYDPSQGIILINGEMNIKALNAFQYRSQIAICSNTKIVPGSLFDNLSYGSIVKKDRIIELMKELKLETLCEQLDEPMSALNLSNGQLQRLGIIRTLLKRDCQVFILDEVTSALDPQTKLIAMDCIKRETKNKIVIFISHDFELIEQYSDKVAVIKNGEIAQLGTPIELANQEGLYRQLLEPHLKSGTRKDNS